MLARILHLVRFDLRSLGPVLGAWFGVLALESLVYWLGPAAPDPAVRTTVSLDVAAIVIRFSVTVLLVAGLVHRHPLVGTTAFWRTRPIAPGEVLAAKAASTLLLVVALPFLWFCCTFLLMGLGGTTAAPAALMMAAEQGLLAVFVLALAALSSNLAHVVVGGLAILVFFLQSRLFLAGGPRAIAPFTVLIHDVTAYEVVNLLTVVAPLVMVAVHQHLTLRTRRSIIVLVASVVALAALQARYPLWKLAVDPLSGITTSVADGPQLEFVRSSLRWEHYERLEPGPRPGSDVTRTRGTRYEAQVKEAGQAGSIILAPIRLRTTAAFADGETVSWDPSAPSADQPQAVPKGGTLADQPYATLAAAAGASWLVDPRDVAAERYRVTYLEVPEEMFTRKRTTPATVEVAITARAQRYVVAARMPLGAGVRAAGTDPSYVLRGHSRIETGLVFDVTHARVPAWTFDPPTRFLLRSGAARQALMLSESGVRAYRTTLLFRRSLTFVRQRLEAPLSDRPALTVVDEAWLRDAQVVAMVPEVLGVAHRTIRLDRFVLDQSRGLEPDPAGALVPSGGAK